MYQNKTKYFYENLTPAKLKYLCVIILLLISEIGLANVLLPSVQIGQQQSIVGGDLTANGSLVDIGVDWLAYSPSKSTYFLLTPSLSLSQIKGSQSATDSIAYEQTAVNLAAGIHTRISERLRLQIRISSQQSLGGSFKINSESFDVSDLQSIAHSWTVLLPYSATYRIGLNVTWQNQQITLKDRDEKIGLNSVIYGLYNSWRI
ncbi:hypothetical protein N9D31_03880 [Oligoflexaceae bacterium]|nr:hypothetical protein [Oligoflexaceae bacterium]